MKTILNLLLLSTLLVACQPGTEPSGSDTINTPDSGNSQPQVETSNGPISPEETVPGGETQQAVDSPEARSMRSNAENLLNQKYSGAAISLGEIQSFTTQVVAGTNFRLEVAYTDQKGKSGSLKLTVYRDLDNNYRLTEDNYPAD